jgi:hypothetical protein
MMSPKKLVECRLAGVSFRIQTQILRGTYAEILRPLEVEREAAFAHVAFIINHCITQSRGFFYVTASATATRSTWGI